MTAFTPSGLLFALDAVGVQVTVNAAGDGLTVTGTGPRPPADLMAHLKAMKPDMLAFLSSVKGVHTVETPTAKEETPPGDTPSPSPGVSPSSGDNLPPLPDWAQISARPGHCGSCSRASDAPDWGRYMVTCSCPANAFEGSLKPLALHVGHRCAAYLNAGEEVGRGWRRKGTGKTWGPIPDAVTWDDLPPLEGGHVQGGAA